MQSVTTAAAGTASLRLAPLPRSFFGRDSRTLARALLGCVLLHETREGMSAGLIVETEAYDELDAASHSAGGRTPRNAVMFGPAGFAYVYFSYGVHWCMNIVADRDGWGAAVLLRALEPITGIDLMARRRGLDLADPGARLRLARGPGCLAQAMGIGREHDGADVCRGPLRVARRTSRRPAPAVIATPRIGISKAQDALWRFHLAENAYVSRRASDGRTPRRSHRNPPFP